MAAVGWQNRLQSPEQFGYLRRRRVPFRSPLGHDLIEQRLAAQEREISEESRPLDRQDRKLSRALPQGPLQRLQAILILDQADPEITPAPPVLTRHSRRHSRPRPGPPVNAQRGSALSLP